MKKWWATVLAAMFILFLFSCGGAEVSTEQENKETEKSMFVVVERVDFGWWIVYHKETKVMYAISNGSYNQGTFTVLLNADGTPMTWEK